MASSWKARVLEKAEINQQWLFVRDVCLFVFVGSWWMEPRSSLSFSCCFLFFPYLVFGFSLSLVSRFPLFMFLVLCPLSSSDFIRPNLERNSILIIGIMILYADNYCFIFLLCIWWDKNTNNPAIIRLLVLGFLNINDASCG